MLAGFASNPWVDPVLRTLYFAVLFAAFHTIRRREASLDTASFRLIEAGFLVLTMGFSAFAIMRLTRLEDHSSVFLLLSQSFERGAVFLLGVSLITYGILLSMPAMVESYQVLRRNYLQTQGQLREVRHSHRRMENRFVEMEQFRALGELAAGVAHDLRNPLTIVKTAAEALARKQRDPDDVREHCRVIQRNIERAERTITALLDLGKPRRPTMQRHDLAELLAEVTTLVRPETRRRAVTIDATDAAPLVVETDARLLGQALLNLVLNALQASVAGGRIVLRTRRILVGGVATAAILVEDRGSGLQATDRSQLFSPFFTTKDAGTGLGLLSCRRVLEELGGRIGLFPRLRGGARAVVLLPLETAPAIVEEVAAR
jgi:signal transduction histidine kinase